jgi:hypothetical protein
MRTKENARARFAAALVISLVTISGCGHPYTSVYVANLDDIEYCVAFVQGSGPGDRTDVLVGAHAAGVLVTDPGEITGVVEIRQLDQPVRHRVEITPGHANLIQIETGKLRLDDQADLSSRPAAGFDDATGCDPVDPT